VRRVYGGQQAAAVTAAAVATAIRERDSYSYRVITAAVRQHSMIKLNPKVPAVSSCTRSFILQTLSSALVQGMRPDMQPGAGAERQPSPKLLIAPASQAYEDSRGKGQRY
jgi:hypothetical protein